jgi:hypothetical protein
VLAGRWEVTADPAEDRGAFIGELGAYCPAVVIFDVGAIQPELLCSLFQQPGLRLIGIDPETHQALVWSGRQEAAVEAADLLQVIGG